MAARVLIVDDDAAILRMLERTLTAEGYEVDAVADGPAALERARRRPYDLIVLDVLMPGVDGLTVAGRLRTLGLSTPLLFLTARDAVADRVAGLDAGGDDYLVKPFAVEELLARMRALARRGGAGPRLAFAGLALELGERIAVRGGRSIRLTERETDLLAVLLRRPGRVVSREALRASVWSGAGAQSDNVVDRYVSYLRRKLGEPPLIHTVRGVGYVLRP